MNIRIKKNKKLSQKQRKRKNSQFDKINTSDIILNVMAHYSSHYIYYEDGNKQPLKGISMKLLVLALIAQIGVSAENEIVGHP